MKSVRRRGINTDGVDQRIASTDRKTVRGGEGNKFIGAGRRMGGDGMEIFYKLVLNESGEGKIFSGPEDEPLQCIDWQ